MERSQSMMTRREREAIKLIVIFHMVGLIGISLPMSRPYFLGFVPWHLLLMFILVVINYKGGVTKFIYYLILTATLGFAIEYIGVHRHWPFGDYQYGETLGWQVSGVPLIIGVNWLLLIYSTGVTMQRSKLQRVTSRVVIGSLILVLLDIIIEPVAIKLDYWHWASKSVHMSNYISWLIISAIMLGIFELFKFKRQGPAAPVLLLVQFFFFVLLNLLV